VLVLGVVLGVINGAVVALSHIPDIVVTLATSYVWAGCALLVLAAPGGSAAQWLMASVAGSFVSGWIPKAAVIMLLLVAVVWVPLRRSRLGLALYAVGSSQVAALRSDVSLNLMKVTSYALMGLFAALAGLSLTATTGIGTPVPGNYALMSIAAAVLGGVSLAGGRGGVVGPLVGVVALQLIQTDTTLLNMDTNLASVLSGLILIGVVMLGAFTQSRGARS
jgi:ribose transport system permease protein